MTFTVEQVAQRYADIKQNLPTGVRVIAVTKGFDESAVQAAVAAGFHDVGENYAQEAAVKHQILGDIAARWHFIGQLQRNKVKLLAPFISTWHTVDNEALATEIAKRSPHADVLIQVNMTTDVGRGGCEWSEVASLVQSARTSELNVLGLMGVAPQDQDPQPSFRRLADTAATLDLKELSMGMSGDWEVAVAEGATMIRVGSTLFGSRPRQGPKPG